jgi:PleD family two-component response regulator
MESKRKILVVDDAAINRIVLKKILLDKYDVLEASNGQEALDILHKEKLDISVMLLDLMMPILDGYGVMAKVKENETLSAIPIIVITGNQDDGSETKCLKSGASDFIKKPFNSEVVRNRVDSMIRLRENTILINQIKNDFLTGLYARGYFCESVKEILQANSDKQYDLICCDVVNFKLINERWGRELGDKLLCAIAQHFKKHADADHTTCGRIDSNTFAILKEHSHEYKAEEFTPQQ